MRPILISLLSFFLIACDGLDLDSVDESSSSEHQFSRAELAFNVFFSSSLLNDSGFNNRDGFIILFDTSSTVDEIGLRINSDENALVGNYPWTIIDDELQVSYPNGITCTSTKTAETSLEFTASSSCSGGEPDNDPIRNTLIRPLTFDVEDLETNRISIYNNDDDIRIDFFSNGNFEVRDLNSNGDEVPGSEQLGTYDDHSEYNNVVRLDNPESGEYSLLMLLDGSMTEGTMLEFRYTTVTDTLNEVLIFNINTNNEWDIESLYNNIDIDQ